MSLAGAAGAAGVGGLGWRSGRFRLWLALTTLVLVVLGLLVFLAARYETGQWQGQVEREASEVVQDLRAGFGRNLQSFQATHNLASTPDTWRVEAQRLLVQRREIMLLEWRSTDLSVLATSASPYWGAQLALDRVQRQSQPLVSEMAVACAMAQRTSAPAYAPSYFWPTGAGHEAMEVCTPVVVQGRLAGFTVAVYALQSVLTELVSPMLRRVQLLAFTEPDGSRLAAVGSATRAQLRFAATQLLDLPGNTLVVRLEHGRNDPDVFPNLVTAWVSALSVALLGVLALLLVDIARRQRAETNLAQVLAFRKAMEDSLVTGLRARDMEGRINYVNPAFCDMVGYSADELMGADVAVPYWPSERAQEYQRRQAQRFASGELLGGKARGGFESEFVRRNGQAFPVLIVEAPLIDAKGVQSGWMSAVIDISDKRRAEEAARSSLDRLQAAARLATVGEMASLLSHELNQPLAAISSYAQGAINMIASNPLNALANRQNNVQNDPESDRNGLTHALQSIVAQADRAGKVIRSVNDFVRRREGQREAVAPSKLIDAVMPLVSLHAAQADVLVLVDVDHVTELDPVWCDRTLVEQVLLNLCRNGIQAMDAAQSPRQLRIGVSKTAGNWLSFSVADTGAGIDALAATHLFTTFFTTKAEGMGLGLSLCRTVVEQHGGTLNFAPQAPRGTVFQFTLPTQPALHPSPPVSGLHDLPR